MSWYAPTFEPSIASDECERAAHEHGHPKLDEVPLIRLQLSQNEEHTLARIESAGAGFDLSERTHHYLIATLARRRLHDVRTGRSPDSQGWIAVELLADMLGIDVPHLNIQVHRARRQVESVRPPGAIWPELVQRRRGELRWGGFAFSVRRGDCVEGAWPIHAIAPPARVMPCHALSWSAAGRCLEWNAACDSA